MLIEEIIRSCGNANVAQAAVASIGRNFAAEIATAAQSYGLEIGAFIVLSVERFARHGDEGELRSVLSAMDAAQEPVLAGLHRILCIMLASGVSRAERREANPRPRMLAKLCAMEADTRREYYG